MHKIAWPRRHVLGALAAVPFAGTVVAGATTGLLSACGAGSKTPPKLRDAQIVEASIASLQQGMTRGTFSARSVVLAYLDRIAAIDKSGPTLSSIIETNPDALAIADALDAERRRKGPRGPLHGIPLLLKDNIDTDDRMATTAGSLALLDSRPARDAEVARRLREAGAILLGKANLSEWSNYRSGSAEGGRSRSGWSARGGATLNPYCLDADPMGSSAGSAVAVSANLAAAFLGTETSGSILSPAAVSGIVGLKPTVGLTSRAGVIPISAVMDSVGPMARTVEDAAILLGAIAGIDARDSATQRAGKRPADYRVFLDPNGLRGAVIGVAADAPLPPSIAAHVTGAGARLVEIDSTRIEALHQRALASLPAEDEVRMFDIGTTLRYEFKEAIATYLASRRPIADRAPAGAVRTLADLIAFNVRTPAERLDRHDQRLFEEAEASSGLTTPEYVAQHRYNDGVARAILDGLLGELRLDAIVSNGPNDSWGTLAAAIGYPQLTLPYWPSSTTKMPERVVFTAKPFGEPALLGLAYALEQVLRRAGMQRQVPRYLASC
ncbi:amidase family protein [Robbsia sp. KACC 23696]|uniref:amidase family protein n=1 Tax=Robbsia sp. KACC 23696 TaxID=3149231 RepID=UPI00325B2045